MEAGRDGIRNQGREEQGEPTLKELLEGILSNSEQDQRQEAVARSPDVLVGTSQTLERS